MTDDNRQYAVRENWTPVAIDEIPSHFPDEVTTADAPLAWQNNHNQGTIYIDYDDMEGEWLVTGDGSSVARAGSLEAARDKAIEYLLNTRKPSPMVVG